MSSNKVSGKILYVHGVHGGPNTAKHKLLQKHFESIHLPLMPVRQIRLYAKVRLGLIAVSSLVGNYYLTKYIKLAFRNTVISFVALSAVLYLYSKILKKQTVKKMMEASILIQKRAITNFKPDIVIGSSWGGAVLSELLKRKLWTGPSILLAPANVHVEKYLGYDITIPATVPTYVFHGNLDQTIPLTDSAALASRYPHIKLNICGGEDHDLSACVSTQLPTLVSEIIALKRSESI